MTDGGAEGCCKHVRCAPGSLTLGAYGAACDIGYAFGGVAKLESATDAGVDSTLGGGATLGGGTTFGGGVSLGGG